MDVFSRLIKMFHNWRLGKLETVRLRADNLDSLKSDGCFILGLQLSRLYNSLNASHRVYLGIPSDNNPANQRDRLEHILYHAAIISESITTLHKNMRQISSLPSWNSDKPNISFIKEQIANEQSFARTILRLIRDKVVYHYDDKVIRDIINDYPLHDGVRLGQAKSKSGIDLCFPLIDEMILAFVLKEYKPEGTEVGAYESFLDELVNISNSLSQVLMELVTDILAIYMVWE